MFVETLQQEIIVTSHMEVYSLLKEQPDYWHVLSICDPLGDIVLPAFERTASLERLCFDDVVAQDPAQDHVAACPADLRKALQFSHRIGSAPMLIHCWAGISRSTAVAWILIYDKLRGQPYPVSRAYRIVRMIRPCLQPNPHVVRMGLECLHEDPVERREAQQQFDLFLQRE